MTVREGGHAYAVVFLGGLTSPGYQLAGNPLYPTIADDFERSFAVVRALPCDIFLGAHCGYFGLTAKRSRMGKGKVNPFIDPKALAHHVDTIERSFDEELAAQRRKNPSA
jgi:metallo-beta-lactamase class B